MPGPFAFAMAGAGGLQGLVGGILRNRGVEDSFEDTARLIGKAMTQNRVNSLIAADRLSRQGSLELGRNLNAVDPSNVAAMRAIAARIGGGVALDSFAIREEAKRREESLIQRGKSAESEAKNQLVSPLLNGITGAARGFAQGAQLDAAMSSADLSAQVGDASLATDQAYTRFLQGQAAASVPPDSLFRSLFGNSQFLGLSGFSGGQSFNAMTPR